MMHMSGVLQPSDSSENEQQMSHMDQGNEIDGESNFLHFYTFQEPKIIKAPPKSVLMIFVE